MTHHGGRVEDYLEGTGRTREEIIDFSANINPLGPPAGLLPLLIENMGKIQDYPDAKHRAAKQAIADFFQVPEANLVCGNGAAEVIDLFFQRIRPKRTFLLQPAFSEYELSARRYGCTVHSLQLDVPGGFALPAELQDQSFQPDDVLVLNNPHNPSGRLWTRTELEPTVQNVLAQGAYVLLDESFMDFVKEENGFSLLQQSPDHERLLVVRSATKMYAIPGLRFGVAVCSRLLAGRLEEYRDGWSVNALAQLAAAHIYRDDAFRSHTYAWLEQELAFIRGTWGRFSAVQLYQPGVNYALVRFLQPELTIAYVVDELRKLGLFVRECHQYPGLDDRYMRFAIRTRAENQTLWGAFQNLVERQE